jgi:hypothetical protein
MSEEDQRRLEKVLQMMGECQIKVADAPLAVELCRWLVEVVHEWGRVQGERMAQVEVTK